MGNHHPRHTSTKTACKQIKRSLALFFVPIGLLSLLVGCQSSHTGTELVLDSNDNSSADYSKNFLEKPKLFHVFNSATNELPRSTSQKSSLSSSQAPEWLDLQNQVDDSGDSPLDDQQLLDADSSDATSNPLLCDSSIYYKSWSEQFDQQWDLKHTNYNSRKDKTEKLLVKTDEFIRMVLPSLEKTGYDLPFVMNAQVLKWISYFTGKGRENFALWLRRGQQLIPQMKQVLEQNGLPSDLVYLSMIESGFSPVALSHAGAVGTWQFMPATARSYGLKINDWVDERRDAVRSTEAASRYLSDLYSQFGSWHLAAAGYNGGPGLMTRTLRHYGENSSFFELTSRRAINEETANYVPKILASMIVAKNPGLFGFSEVVKVPALQTKTISLNRSLSLSDISKVARVEEKILRELNPQLRLGLTPPPWAVTGGHFQLVVPANKQEQVIASLPSIPDAPREKVLLARVKRKEKISKFASHYNVTLASLLKANHGLSSGSSLQKGQVIQIPVALGTGMYDKFLVKPKLARHKYISRHNNYVGIKTHHRRTRIAFRD